MAKFDSVADFRSKSTQQDLEDLKKAYTGLKSTEWDNLSDTYGFSRSSALKLLREADLIGPGDLKRTVSSKKKTKQSVELNVKRKPLKTKLRPTRMTDETWNKLQLILDKYGYMNRDNVMDAILNEVLDKYA